MRTGHRCTGPDGNSQLAAGSASQTQRPAQTPSAPPQQMRPGMHDPPTPSQTQCRLCGGWFMGFHDILAPATSSGSVRHTKQTLALCWFIYTRNVNADCMMHAGCFPGLSRPSVTFCRLNDVGDVLVIVHVHRVSIFFLSITFNSAYNGLHSYLRCW